MRIGILGSGVVGQTLGSKLIELGYDVMIGTRSTEKMNDWIKKTKKGKVGSFEEAAKFGKLIILATLGIATTNVVQSIDKSLFKGKVVIDTTNPLDFSRGVPPILAINYPDSQGKNIQESIPKAKVVKAFNTVAASIMINPKLSEGKPQLFIAGDNDGAKKETIKLAKEFGWTEIIDIGNIEQSFLLETFAMLWITYGFKYNVWTHAFRLMKK